MQLLGVVFAAVKSKNGKKIAEREREREWWGEKGRLRLIFMKKSCDFYLNFWHCLLIVLIGGGIV